MDRKTFDERVNRFAATDAMHQDFVDNIWDDIIDWDGDEQYNFVERLQDISFEECSPNSVSQLSNYSLVSEYFNQFYTEIYDFLAADKYIVESLMLDANHKGDFVDLLMCGKDSKTHIVFVVYEIMTNDLLDLVDDDRYDAVWGE